MIIYADIARQLIQNQFPQWQHLPITPVEKSGWDNRMFHLGSDKLIRLPSHAKYEAKVYKEQQWLPILARQLTLQIPKPLALGKPTSYFPFAWSVYAYIPGQTVSLATITTMQDFAYDLAQFLNHLHTLGTKDAPVAGERNFYRGGNLQVYDAQTHQALQILSNTMDTTMLEQIWNNAVQTSWQQPAIWIHGDLTPDNMLVQHGRLSAIIDWGGTAIGDPSCDLAIAWTFLDDQARQTFKDTLHLDEQTWVRGMAWALWKAAIIAAKLPGTNEALVDHAHQTLRILAQNAS